MIKNDKWITEFASGGGITPFNPEAVNPASYDISIGEQVILYPSNDKTKRQEWKLNNQGSLFLQPGEKALVVSLETIKTPNDIAVTVRLKSSLARQMIISPIGLFIDPGFEGRITLCLINLGVDRYELKEGRRIGQFIFNMMNAPAEIPYGDPRRTSHYQGSVDLTENKSTL
jgi:dCTP deaminase